jgi:putative transposase
LRSRVSELFSQSRSAAGSRSLLSLMRDDGEQLGRFKVRSLMRELDLVSKQPGSHAYNRATVERLDTPNILNREFDVPAPNQVWCGDITYIWAGEMALSGGRAGSLRAPGGGLGVVGKAGRRSG